MAIDKAIEYKMQGGKKPARNYLGKQKTVSNVPVKWKSGPDAPETELAYITKAEKDLILKKNLHGSLKNGPNTGPDGIMSLDSQGDYTRDRSPAGRQSSPGGPDRSRQSQAQHEQHMREILTGQKNIGQTTKTGPKTRKYAVPEYVNVKQPDGTYKNKYIGSGYKSYGTPSFFGNLFSRGAPGYRGIKGMPAFWGKPGFETRGVPGQKGFGYYSDNENFGETRDAFPKFGLMGLISSLAEKFKKPKDMSEFNELGLYDERVNPDYYNDLDNELMLSTKETPISKAPMGTPWDNPYKAPMGTPWDNPYKAPDSPEWTSWEVPPGMMNEAYQDNLEFFDNLNKGIVKNNEPPMVNTDNVMQGSVLDAKPKKGIMQMIKDAFITPAGAAEFDMEAFQKAGAKKGWLGANDELEAMKEYYDAAKSLTAPGAKFAGAANPQAVRDFITQQSELPMGMGSYGVEMGMVPENFMNTTEDFTTQKDPLSFFADGGIASMFTRRG